jgi:hypothetical protein
VGGEGLHVAEEVVRGVYPTDVQTEWAPRPVATCSQSRWAVPSVTEQRRRGIRSGGPHLEERERMGWPRGRKGEGPGGRRRGMGSTQNE